MIEVQAGKEGGRTMRQEREMATKGRETKRIWFVEWIESSINRGKIKEKDNHKVQADLENHSRELEWRLA